MPSQNVKIFCCTCQLASGLPSNILEREIGALLSFSCLLVISLSFCLFSRENLRNMYSGLRGSLWPRPLDPCPPPRRCRGRHASLWISLWHCHRRQQGQPKSTSPTSRTPPATALDSLFRASTRCLWVIDDGRPINLGGGRALAGARSVGEKIRQS